MGKGSCGTITAVGTKSGEGRFAKTQGSIFSVDKMADVGTDDGTRVADYGKSAKFNGKIAKITMRQSPSLNPVVW
ncbi:MAG TPA: hypothetical protein VK658_04120 [Chryseolinea sp.]|nr:hypothetical protein [Chryseolinea sp.]